MKTNININFYKSLILSDFCLIQKSFKSFNFYVLNIYKILTSWQVLIKQLLFFKKIKKPVLYLKLETVYYYRFIRLFLLQYPINYYINLYMSDIPNFSEFHQSHSESIAIIINKKSTNQNSFFKPLIYQQIFLINQIGLFNRIVENGQYQLNTDLFDIKKILFFLVLLNKV
jgi:hypothetical protein